MPEVSLITCAVTSFNRPEELKRAVKSVIAQTYKDIEILVVDDCSGKDTSSAVASLNDERIRFIKHETNKGLAATRNTAIKEAKSPYIAFLDDDDIWKPERIKKQVELLQGINDAEKFGVVYCGVDVRTQDDRTINLAMEHNLGNLKTAVMRDGIRTISSTFLFSVDALKKIGGFDENLPSSIDDDIWMGFARYEYEAFFVNEPLVVVYDRRGRKTMMSDTSRRIRGVKLFTNKWLPVWQEWFGKEQGRKWADRYFATVIAMLAAETFASGRVISALIAIRKIFSYSSETCFNIKIVCNRLAAETAKKILPLSIQQKIRQRKQKI